MTNYTVVTERYGPWPCETFDEYLPKGVAGPVPEVFLIHGGAWISGSRAQFESSAYPTGGVAAYLASRGVAAVAMDYPLHDCATGWGSLGMIINAVRSCVNFVNSHARSLSVDPTRSAAWGMSAGGQIASFLGALGVVRSVVADSAPENFSTLTSVPGLENQLLPTAYSRRYWSTESHLCAGSAAEWCLAGGTLDSAVPLSTQTDPLARALDAAGLSECEIPYYGGHSLWNTSATVAGGVVAEQEAWVIHCLTSSTV